jgi:glycosyltransferase involved in cell wall biosynthesis
MNVMFICHNQAFSNSGIHVTNLGHALKRRGYGVALAVPDESFAVTAGDADFHVMSYSEALNYSYPNGKRLDLIHAWTPRQGVAHFTRKLSKLAGCPYVVHLEDHEVEITASSLGVTVPLLYAMVNEPAPLLIPVHLSHPAEMPCFLEHSIGLTALMDRLLEMKPSGLPGIVFWPAAEDQIFYPQAADASLRRRLTIGKDTKIVVYNGNVHSANVKEVSSLYLAVAALAREGMDIVLLRLGTDAVPLFPDKLVDTSDFSINVPFQPRELMGHYLALADILVQPGSVNAFNSHRFPSKLPEFFAMGKPVVLPKTNIGLLVQPGVEGLILENGSALEIASRIREVLLNKNLAARLAEGSRRFYERMFSWDRSAQTVDQFYRGLSTVPPLKRLDDDSSLKVLVKHYESSRCEEELGYATVRDYVDGVDHLPALATLNQDLKDAQRPWVFKTILSSVPKGGRLLEIGAGDPWVADLLARSGYEVVIVDPYDGRDRGPAEFEAIKKQFPSITFLRGLFPDALIGLSDQNFDCIYSISVLEHIPIEFVEKTMGAIRKYSRSASSPTIHAIDHVLLGEGDEAHYKHLLRLIGSLSISGTDLDRTLDRARNDSETYFLSAEAHNRWRGVVPYIEFPMRKCISIQLNVPSGRSVG